VSAASIKDVPWRVRDALVVFAASWVGLPLAILVALSLFSTVWPPAGSFYDRILSEEIEANFMLALATSIASLVLVMAIVRRYGGGWQDLGLRRFDFFKALLWVAGMFIAFGLAANLLLFLLDLLIPAFDPNQVQSNEFTSPTTPETRRLSLIALVLLPAFIEELVFRGFLFPAFARRFGWVGGALIASVLFGIAHWQPNVIAYTVLIGLVLCLLYRQLGSIWPGILLHMLNNYIAFTEIIKS
jgi:membrane protease YdiL (CAAX protease family)